MKKIIPAILVLVLLITMSSTAFASDTTETEPGNSHEVLATFEEGNVSKTIVSVDISWNKMSFTYNGASEPVWDALKHQYVGEATEAGWAPSDATITITNHSNTVLQANISYSSESAYSGIRMHFTDAAPYIGSAHTAEEGAGTPCEVTVKAIPDGELPAETEDNTRIGTITVKVTADIIPIDVVSVIEEKTGIYSSQDTTKLTRGGVFFAPETNVDEILDLVVKAYDADGGAEPALNTAVNALITAYYGALDIVQ